MVGWAEEYKVSAEGPASTTQTESVLALSRNSTDSWVSAFLDSKDVGATPVLESAWHESTSAPAWAEEFDRRNARCGGGRWVGRECVLG